MRSYYDKSGWLVGDANLIIWKNEISVIGWQRDKIGEYGGRHIHKTYRRYEAAWRCAYRMAIGTK